MQSPAKNTVASARLDLIRGLAASFVVWDHVNKLFFERVNDAVAAAPGAFLKQHPGLFFWGWSMEQGFTAVTVFFVLSGFLIGGAVKRAMEKGWDWPRYLIARCTRLCVPLFPALLVGGLMDYFGYQYFGGNGIYEGRFVLALQDGGVAGHLTFETLIGNLCFLQTMYVPVWGSNGPLWSLDLEFWYYLYLPLTLLLFALRKRSAQVGTAMILLGALVLTGRWALPLFPVWAIGAILAFVDLPFKRLSRSAVWACWGFFVACLLLKWVKDIHLHHMDYYLTGIGFTVAFIGTLLAPSSGEHARKNWFVTWSASISYTLYLVHYPLLMLLSAWLIGDRAPFAMTPANAPIAVGILLTAWLFATIMWWLAERHTDKVRGWAERMWHRHMRATPEPA